MSQGASPTRRPRLVRGQERRKMGNAAGAAGAIAGRTTAGHMELLSTWLKSMHHAHRDNDHKGNSRENAHRRRSDVWELSSTFDGRVTSHTTVPADVIPWRSSSLLAARSMLRAGGNGVRNAPSAIFSIRWRWIARAALSFRIHTFRNCRPQTGEILVRPLFAFIPTINGPSALFTIPASRPSFPHRSQTSRPRSRPPK